VPTVTERVKLHPAQASFRRSDAPLRGFVGGRGSGKSFAGAYDLLARARPGRLYLVTAPTYPMLKDASWRSFLALARQFQALRDVNQSDLRVALRHGAEVLFRSTEFPDRLRGPNLSGCWMDEASRSAAEAFQVVMATLRESGERGWLSATFTPRGRRHWTYEALGTGRPDTELFHASTADNPFLPADFEAGLRRQYTSVYAAQELGGEFIDAIGSVFRREWFGRAEALPAGCVLARYIDKAGTEGGGAYTAGVLMARDRSRRYYVVDVVRGQWSAGRREEIILDTAKADRARYGTVRYYVEQEPGSGGKESVEATIRNLSGFAVKADRPTGDKAVRAQPFAAQAEAGNVFVLPGRWNDDYVEEHAAFPEGPYKDQVDASSGAFNKLAGGPGDGPGVHTLPAGQATLVPRPRF
jgi:predicted phage terminase large subunit-like protein